MSENVIPFGPGNSTALPEEDSYLLVQRYGAAVAKRQLSPLSIEEQRHREPVLRPWELVGARHNVVHVEPKPHPTMRPMRLASEARGCDG